MTLPIERARSRRPITWLTLIGVILLPVVIGGLLVAALYNPTERLDALTAAVVNEDEAVEIDGQLVPLGRQLTAGLVEGSDEIESNLTWTISNPDDAEEGLADGTYAAVITIPENFSSAATSTQPGLDPEQAVIEVTTPPDSLIVDDAITAQIASTAAAVMGEQLSTVYLENVLLGFTTLGDQLGEAADGAGQLADGAEDAADGTVSLADGIAELSSGAGQLAGGATGISGGLTQLAGGAGELAGGATGISGGLTELAGGAGELAGGATGIAEGASGISDGAAQLAAGTSATAAGLDEWAVGAGEIATGQRQLADGLTLMADEVSQLPDVPADMVTAVDGLAAGSEEISTTVTDAAAQLATLSADCVAEGGSPDLCAAIAQLSTDVDGALPAVTGILGDSTAIAEGFSDLAAFEPSLVAGLEQAAAAASGLADGTDELAAGATATADGADALAAGMTSLSSGASELATGATTWASGAQTWAGGASQAATGSTTWASGAQTWAGGASQAATGSTTWASGAQTWASGASSAATGADDLATGLGTLADGTDDLATGLQTAVDGIPTYTDEEASDVATVVATPVAAEGVGTSLFGASAVPLLTVLALWFGGLGSFIALQAVPRSALASRRPSAVLALRALLPAAGIGALQGLLVAGVVQLAASYTWAEWGLFAALCVVAGVAFAAVNQALVAVFGGAGRWVAALVGVLTVATGIVSTVPGFISDLAGLMPTAPAYNGMVAALTSTNGVGAAVAGLLIWSLAALAVTVFAVTRRRSVSAQQLLAPSTALA